MPELELRLRQRSELLRSMITAVRILTASTLPNAGCGVVKALVIAALHSTLLCYEPGRLLLLAKLLQFIGMFMATGAHVGAHLRRRAGYPRGPLCCVRRARQRCGTTRRV